METIGIAVVACLAIALVAHYGGDRLHEAAAERADRARTWPRAIVWTCVAGAIFVGAMAIEHVATDAPKQAADDYNQQQLQQQQSEYLRDAQDGP